MPDKDGRYSDAEKGTYRSPRCPNCDGPTDQNWIDVSSQADPHGQGWWIPGTYRCAKRTCVQTT